MTDIKKAKTIVLIEKLRFIESELFRIASKYGIKTIDELDALIAKGKISEETIGEDLFLYDTLLSEKENLERELRKLKVAKNNIWKSLQNLLELPKLNFHK